MSLLPGARELRSPLAAGTIWLVAIYMSIAPLLPADLERVEQPVVRDTMLLAGRLQPGVTLAALAFVAYLLGIINAALTRATNTVGAQIARTARRIATSITFPAWRILEAVQQSVQRIYERLVYRVEFSSRGYSMAQVLADLDLNLKDGRGFSPSSLTGYIVEKIVQRFGAETAFWAHLNGRLHGRIRADNSELWFYHLPVPRAEGTTSRTVAWMIDREYYTSALRDDLRLLPSRLVSKEPAVFERWNRINAEAEFRMEMMVPITALSVVIAYRIGISEPDHFTGGALVVSAIGAGIVLTLSRLSAERSREARIQLLEALDIGLGQSRILQEISQGELRLRGLGYSVDASTYRSGTRQDE